MSVGLETPTHQSSMQRTIITLVVLSAASLYLTYILIDVAKTIKVVLDTQRVMHTSTNPVKSYSFLGRDHPRYLPADHERVRMAVEESVHYPIIGPAAKEEWLWTAALGDNHVRLGPEKRMFAVAMFHQLHCLRGIRESLEIGWETMSLSRRGHIHHCFNYIRQWTLCDGDLTLEPGDFTKRNFTIERQGAVHTCRDWELVYDYMAERWNDWTRFRIEHNIPYIDAD